MFNVRQADGNGVCLMKDILEGNDGGIKIEEPCMSGNPPQAHRVLKHFQRIHTGLYRYLRT